MGKKQELRERLICALPAKEINDSVKAMGLTELVFHVTEVYIAMDEQRLDMARDLRRVLPEDARHGGSLYDLVGTAAATLAVWGKEREAHERVMENYGRAKQELAELNARATKEIETAANYTVEAVKQFAELMAADERMRLDLLAILPHGCVDTRAPFTDVVAAAIAVINESAGSDEVVRQKLDKTKAERDGLLALVSNLASVLPHKKTMGILSHAETFDAAIQELAKGHRTAAGLNRAIELLAESEAEKATAERRVAKLESACQEFMQIEGAQQRRIEELERAQAGMREQMRQYRERLFRPQVKHVSMPFSEFLEGFGPFADKFKID